MPRLACPGCGAIVDLASVTRSSEEFCSSCDYPLFWAGSGPRPDEEGGLGLKVRRYPGTSGRQAIAFETCPACQEPNKPTNTYCQRCGAELHPVAPLVTPTLLPASGGEATPLAAPTPPPAAPAPHPWWKGWMVVAILFLLLAALTIAAVVALVIWG